MRLLYEFSLRFIQQFLIHEVLLIFLMQSLLGMLQELFLTIGIPDGIYFKILARIPEEILEGILKESFQYY